MPKLNRGKLLEYLDNNYSEELNLSSIVRYCEVDENVESEKIKTPKRKRRRIK
jgi:predicted DNA-binding ribbon-helix-helix protein